MNKNLLVNGVEAFPSIISHIQNAKEEIIISMFIWRDDSIGNTIAEELINAANRGVKVHIIKDKVGSIFEEEEENRKSFFHKDFDIKNFFTRKVLSLTYFSYLDKANNNTKNSNLSKMIGHNKISLDIDKWRSDHSKYYLIDKKYLILGGINIEDKELYTDKKGRKYSDYMIEIADEDEILHFLDLVVNRKQNSNVQPKSFYINNNSLQIFEIKDKTLKLLDKAKTSIDIEMAYWGDKNITNKVIEMANRGIEVSIITSKNANLQNDFNMKIMSTILMKTNNKVKIRLSKRMVHSKFLCIDKNILFFGSANFNSRGMNKLSELNVLIENNTPIINDWLISRKEHLKECITIQHPREFQYNRIISFIEKFFS